MTPRRWLAALLCLLGLAPDAAAQTATDERLWVNVTLQDAGPSTSPWRWTLETIGRSRDGVRTLDLLTVRPTLIYAVSSRVSVGGGYLISSSFPSSGGVSLEQRPFGQVVVIAPMGGTAVTFRTRMEARFLEDNSGVLGRLRQLVRISHPIRRGSRVALVTYDELMLHVNDTSRTARGIDQNRAFAGVAIARNAARIEAGYLNQFSPGHRGATDRMNHILSVGAVVFY